MKMVIENEAPHETTRTVMPTPYRDKVRAMKRRRGELAASQPEVMKAFAALSEAASLRGALDEKIKELIALAIGVVTRCDECIAIHTHEAVKAGATRQEIIEALGVAILMGGGPALMYSAHALDALSEFAISQDAVPAARNAA